ncbi:MAG: ROK family protein [Chloroflexi bacterium]|nr:MAG: ROK family protein [Chloroflexota bacterium]
MALQKANRDLMRDLNTSLVVNLVKGGGPISRAELARQSKLSPATITGIVARLVRLGVLSELAIGPSKLGRPPVLLRLNERAGYVIGIKLKEHGLTTVVTNLAAEVVHSAESDTHLIGDPQAALVAIEDAVRHSLTESGVKRKMVLGIGIGLAGVIDAGQGVCRYSHILHWQDVALSEPLRRKLQIPVWVDNDVNTLAVAEKWFGAGIGLKHFLTVTVGRGIGLGIVLNGEIYRGAIGGAGEFGHIVVAPDGPSCQCGRSGCLEALVSEPVLVNRISAALGRQVSADEMLELAGSGHAVVTAVLAEAGQQLGLALANLVTLLNPERLIVSGEGTRLGPAMFDTMQERIRSMTFDGLAAQMDIVIQPWGDRAWAIGAATLVLRELFSLPVAGEPHGLALIAEA